MVLIRCRQCNRTVLSAASQCPHCLRPMDADQRDAIDGDRRSMMLPALLGIGLVLAIVITVWRTPGDAESPLNVAPVLIPTPAVASVGSTVHDTIREQGTFEEDGSASEPMTLENGTRTEIGQDRPPPSAKTRWTSTWVNVRERPDPTSPVVLVLSPGRQLLAVSPERGWSRVYADAERAGYLWAALLADRPDTDIPR